MSSPVSTPAPSFGVATACARAATSSGALSHLRGRAVHLVTEGKPLLTWLGCGLFLLMFLGEATTMHPMYVVLSGTAGGMFLWGTQHPSDGTMPLLPIGTRTRISVDAALILLPAGLLLPFVQLAANGVAWKTYAADLTRDPDRVLAIPMGLDERMGLALGMILLAYPLVMASLLVPPKKYNWRAMLPALPVVGLIALGWALGITETLLGTTLLSAAAIALVLAAAKWDWPDAPAELSTFIPGLGLRGPLARAAVAPTTRVRADFLRGVARWSAIIVLGSLVGWGALLLTGQGSGTTTVGLMATMVPLMLPRLMALASAMDLSWLATGFNQPFETSPWGSLPAQRRSLEGWSLLHYLTIAVVCGACDLLLLAVVVSTGTAELSGGSIAVIMAVGTNIMLPWLAATIHLLRYRYRGSGTLFAGLVLMIAGLQAFPLLIAVMYYVLLRNGGALMPGSGLELGPWGSFLMFITPAAALMLGLWAAVLGGFRLTMPKRAQA